MSVSEANKFAWKFKPTFRSCDLGLLCQTLSEKVELEFVLRYWPFSKYKPKKKNVQIKPQYKELIKKEWEKNLSNGTLSFDDEKTLNDVNEQIKRSYELNIDEDSSEYKANKKIKTDESPKLAENLSIQEQIYQDKIQKELTEYRPAIKRTVFFERGNCLEKSIIDAINKTKNMNFVQDRSLKVVDFDLFKICGIPDGIDAEKKTLIEVKTRNFIIKGKTTVNPKERIQCLCYMKLTNCDKCLLVESNQDGEQNIITIDWDNDEFEEKIQNRLTSFVEKYRSLSENEFKAKIFKYPDIICN